MAPHATKAPDANASSSPLADYFFIAGIESSQIQNERNVVPGSPPPVETTIEEDKALETETVTSPRPSTSGSPTPAAQKRRSRYSFEAHKSIGSIILPLDVGSPNSNRSSAATLKAPQLGGLGLSDEDFEQALRKFASERDSFLEEIHVSAGTVTHHNSTSTKPTRTRPKTVRINNAEDQAPSSGLRNGVGSLRRKLSTMNSMKRQSLTTQRQCASDP